MKSSKKRLTCMENGTILFKDKRTKIVSCQSGVYVAVKERVIMKRAYVRPLMECETFVANEYVAACGDSGTVYKFKCDAGGGRSGHVYLETNGRPGLQTEGPNSDRYLSSYHACGTTHEAESTDDFLDGYYVANGNVTSVIVWRGPRNNNTHCTANLDMNTWETAKS